MSKKNKKKPQQNLSLKDRLAKHWNNSNWGAFISLYARDKAASMRTPWAERWQDALYNCLTEELFVEKNFQAAEMALDLIRGEGEEISSRLRDCACVAADFLYARRRGLPAAVPYPLGEEANLPPLYASLRYRFVSLVSDAAKRKKASKNDAAALVKKLAAQYDRLKNAKSASPWLTWMKIAEQLEAAARGTDSAETFCAVHAIVRLQCELVRHTRGADLLRDVEALPRHPLFCAIPGNQSHPAIGMLWDFFCRLGERKYGEEWGMTARVLQLSFMAKTDRLESLKKQYDRLAKMDEYADERDLVRPLLSSSLGWTEQERYILRILFMLNYEPEIDEDGDIPAFMENFKILVESFEVLGRLGRRWRPQAPWPTPVRDYFEEIVLGLPLEMLAFLAERDLPWEILSTPSILFIVLHDRNGAQRLKKAVSSKLPLPLSPEDIQKFLCALNPNSLKAMGIRTMRMFLDDAGYARLFESWVRQVVLFSSEDARNGDPPSQQMWNAIGKDTLRELAATLPSDSPEGCLCRLLREGGKLCSDSPEADAFFGALSSRIAQSDPDNEEFEWTIHFLMFLLTWPEVSSHFLLRLIGEALPPYHLEHWGNIADILERMTDRSKRKTVALALCARMKRLGAIYRSVGFTAALRHLEKLGRTTRKR
jgi:hypothetical protein